MAWRVHRNTYIGGEAVSSKPSGYRTVVVVSDTQNRTIIDSNRRKKTGGVSMPILSIVRLR